MTLKKILRYLLAAAYVTLGSVILFGANYFFIPDKSLKIILGVACIAYGIFRAYRAYVNTL